MKSGCVNCGKYLTSPTGFACSDCAYSFDQDTAWDYEFSSDDAMRDVTMDDIDDWDDTFSDDVNEP